MEERERQREKKNKGEERESKEIRREKYHRTKIKTNTFIQN